jgi:RNA polymerase sigma factor (sigma-70 family)
VEQDVPMEIVDPAGLGETYREHGPKLWRALVAYSGSRDIADDALAEAFAQAAARGDAIRKPDRWVWTAAFRIAAGALKERSSSQLEDRSVSLVDETAALDLILALRKLPSRQRAVLVLHYYGGYKAREIAHITGSTAATVRVHLSAGRKRLRELLEVDDD